MHLHINHRNTLILLLVNLLLETLIFFYGGILGSILLFTLINILLIKLTYINATLGKNLSLDKLFFKLVFIKILWRGFTYATTLTYIMAEPLVYLLLVATYLVCKDLNREHLINLLDLIGGYPLPLSVTLDSALLVRKTQVQDIKSLSRFRVKVGFQFRHLTYLHMPPSIQIVLSRRTHFISIALFAILIIVEGMFAPSMYDILDIDSLL